MASTIPPFSTLGKSVMSMQPYAAPPTFPQTNYIMGSSPMLSSVTPGTGLGHTGDMKVNSAFRTAGMSFMYRHGAQAKKWFREIMTGGVESTKFQPVTSGTEFHMGNGELYAAGFPRNLGWSEKVPTIDPRALGIDVQSQMAPAPRMTRNVYTRRSFTTAPSIPAVPMNGR